MSQLTPDSRAAALLAALSLTSTASLAPALAQTAGGAVALPEVSATANAAAGSGKGPPLSPSEKAGYSAPPVASAGKINVPAFDLPISIQTVPEQVIVDQNALSLADALQNVSGVRSNSNNVEGYVYNIRGFRSDNIYRNGLMVGVSIPQSYGTANLQAVEVLKGPASFLFGRADPGGVINQVTKKPLDTPYYSLTSEFGSFNLWRTLVDATGPIPIPGIADKSVTYRFNGSYINGGEFVDFITNQNVFLAPSLRWQIDGATTLTVEAEYNHLNSQSNVGQPAVGLGLQPYTPAYPANIPVYRSFGEPNQPPDTVRSALIAYNFRHEFDSNWALTNRFLATRATLEKATLNGNFFTDGETVIDRGIGYQKLTGTNYSANLDLTGRFDIFGVRNDVLIGADYFYQFYNYIFSGDGNYPINIYNPIYGTIPTSAFWNAAAQAWQGTADFSSFSSHSEKDLGIYAQDSITLTDNIRIFLGGRYDLADVHNGSDVNFALASRAFGVSPVEHSQAFSPRAGINITPTPWLSIYGSYTRSFGAPNGISTTGIVIPPQISVGWEGGVKAELLDRRLTGTLAFFQITKSNVVTPNTATPDPNDVIPIGLSRSTGVELDILGKLTDEWSIIASYAHINAKVLNTALDSYDPPQVYIGNSLNSYAPDSGSLWLTYACPTDSLLHGWIFGGGVYAASNRWGNDLNTFVLPAYARIDAMAKYQVNAGGARWSAQINLKNIANATYYDSNDVFFNNTGRFGVFPGAPRAVTASLRVEF